MKQPMKQAEIEATTTANESRASRAYKCSIMREAGHDEETIQETLEMNDLGEYYEPPVDRSQPLKVESLDLNTVVC